jgi:hypothetical protein
MLTARVTQIKKSRRRSLTVVRRTLPRRVESMQISRVRTPSQTTRRTERSLNDSTSITNEGI